MTPILALASFLAFVAVCPQDGDLKSQIRDLQTKADDAPPELVRKIADAKSREAMTGLVTAYDGMSSVFMRREIVRALGVFDGVKDAEQPALQKVTDVILSAPEEELRDAGLKTLSGARSLGKHFLEQIVRSRAPDLLREQALAEHIKRPEDADKEFYQFIWNPKRERRKDADGNVVSELEGVREYAFKGLQKMLTDSELVDTMRDEFNPKIRRAALRVLSTRNSPKTAEMAKWMFERVDFPGQDRVAAARVLARAEGGDCVKTFLKLAKKRDVTTEDLRQVMADLICEMDDEGANKKVAKLVGKGKPHEKVFALRATRHLTLPKLLKKIRKGLSDKDFSVRAASAEALAFRRDKEALPIFEAMLEKPKTTGDLRVAIEAMSEILGRKKSWRKRLSAFAGHAERDVRNAALEQIWNLNDTKAITELGEALVHPDWTTRLLAVRGLEGIRRKDGIPILLGRLEAEDGRLETAIADALWQLTGKPFGKDPGRWQAWWKSEGEDFKVISDGDLAMAKKEREEKRLKQRTVTDTEFFGIKIDSHRVIFIVDVSGSMTAPVEGEYVGKRGATRLDIAKRELAKAVEGLQANALFNILSFSSGIGYFIKEGITSVSGVTRESALEFVDRLGAGGATNLFDTVKVAFEDPDVDTIFLLSDGEPTSGELIDPHRIRERVAFWNKHRRVKIHTIAIGGNLEVLEWLAEDSGGDHVRIR